MILISKQNLRAVVSILVFLIVWEIIYRTSFIDGYFISSPGVVFSEGLRLIESGFIWPHFLISSYALIVGYFAALFLGVAFGLSVGICQKIYDYLRPHIVILSTMPIVALIPLIIIWFGVGIFSKIVVVFIMVLGPVLVSTLEGVANAQKNFLRMALSFGADNFFILRKVVFFETLPFIFSGMRLAVGRAIAGLVLAEVFGYGKGLGFLVAYYGSTYQIAKLLFVVMLLLCIAGTMELGILFLQKKMIRYK